MWAELETGRPAHPGLSEVTFNPSKEPQRASKTAKETECVCVSACVRRKLCFFLSLNVKMPLILVDLLSWINPEWFNSVG